MPQTNPATGPLISVIIPVYNGSNYLQRCLAGVFASDYASFEVIVIDDNSIDGSAGIAGGFPCAIVKSRVNAGPAAARNTGAAEARGSVYFFLDADIIVERDTLTKIADFMNADAGLAALFGSYGRQTIPVDFFSRYKNLLHHYTHQRSREVASTFCGGFGAIRREAFQRLGGFDPQCRFLEDIEFGYRMNREGLRVRLCKDLQMTHCKRYTLASLIRSDIVGRAIPWTRLMLEAGIFKNDLNTRWNNVLSVPVAFLLLASPALPARLLAAPLLLCLFVALNAGLLWLTYSEGGPIFALQSCLMSWLGYIYSGVGVVFGFAAFLRGRPNETVGEASDPSES